MKIINLGILAHVDAGKTTLTESLLYTSGAIAELGSVDEGTTRTDTMNLERQRGITIQTAVTSFQWEDVKVNIIDTPGHMDFLAEVYRSLSVLDGAVLLVSAKDGIQAQTRILFHALQTMKIPTIFFINKIDQEGIDLPMVYREMKAKLSSEIIVKQKVGQHPHINVTDNDDMEQWDAVIMGNDELLEKYMSGKPFKMSELEQEENRRFQNGTLFPVYHGSAKNNLGIRQLIEVIASKFYSSTPEGQSELCGQVFKIEYSEKRRRFVYVRIYSGTLHLRDVIKISEKEKIKITEMCVPTNGELYSSDTACSGDIVILPNDVLQLNSILGNEMLLPQRTFIENPLPMLQTTIAAKKSEQREILLGALTEISDGDPLLKYYVDTTTHEIILSFLGNVQMEVICAILEEKYHVEAEIKEPTVIYMERPLRKAEYTNTVKQLVFVWYNNSYSGTGEAGAIDNIRLEAVSCAKPQSFTVSTTDNGTDIDATLTINDRDEIGSYIVEYKKSSEQAWTSLEEPLSDPYTINGLDYGTVYNIRIATYCSETDTSTFTDVVSFTTPCAAIPAPWSEEFSTQPDAICWTKATALLTDTATVQSSSFGTSTSWIYNAATSIDGNATGKMKEHLVVSLEHLSPTFSAATQNSNKVILLFGYSATKACSCS